MQKCGFFLSFSLNSLLLATQHLVLSIALLVVKELIRKQQSKRIQESGCSAEVLWCRLSLNRLFPLPITPDSERGYFPSFHPMPPAIPKFFLFPTPRTSSSQTHSQPKSFHTGKLRCSVILKTYAKIKKTARIDYTPSPCLTPFWLLSDSPSLQRM